MAYYIVDADALYHHGIKGQKWGVRRYQNEDGSYTAAGAINTGKARASACLSKDLLYSEAVTRIGFNSAEEKFNKRNGG